MSQITDAAADTREPQAVAALREELMGAGLWEILEDPELTDLVIHGEVVFVTTLSKGTYRAKLSPDPLAVESLIASIASYNSPPSHSGPLACTLNSRCSVRPFGASLWGVRLSKDLGSVRRCRRPRLTVSPS